MAHVATGLPARRRFAETMRRDAWWVEPALTFTVLAAFLVYANWAAFQNAHYTFGPYLSPFYSPELWGSSHHAWFGPKPDWWPGFLPFSPALLVLWAPGLFRMTCYYYRGSYYKAFIADPVSCAVGEPKRNYKGETGFPLLLQNLHRYFMYLALPFLLILAYDVWKALWFENPATGRTEFGIGLGTLILAVNVVLLSGYVFGCHSFRHWIGGKMDSLAKRPLRRKAYDCVSCLNRKHMNWAWPSLFWVAFSDIYVRLCSMGIWQDWRIL
jgi:hypothetical protein